MCQLHTLVCPLATPNIRQVLLRQRLPLWTERPWCLHPSTTKTGLSTLVDAAVTIRLTNLDENPEQKSAKQLQAYRPPIPPDARLRGTLASWCCCRKALLWEATVVSRGQCVGCVGARGAEAALAKPASLLKKEERAPQHGRRLRIQLHICGGGGGTGPGQW